jgi:hypothetical protein
VARYFLHLRDSVDIALDDEGYEYENESALAAAMLVNVRDMMKGDVEAGHLDLRLRLDAETADGRVVRSLPFLDAVRITYPGDETQRAAA